MNSWPWDKKTLLSLKTRTKVSLPFDLHFTQDVPGMGLRSIYSVTD